jgi:hypothetical protein
VRERSTDAGMHLLWRATQPAPVRT